jgi:hypothetical protein
MKRRAIAFTPEREGRVIASMFDDSGARAWASKRQGALKSGDHGAEGFTTVST